MLIFGVCGKRNCIKTHRLKIAGDDVISFADGTATALAMGVATIKVTAADGFGASTTIDVTVDGKNVEAITLSATEATIYAGENLELTATVTPDDATNTGIVWSSSDEAVATVDEAGKVTALAAGEATITATAKDGSGVSASCSLTVKPRATMQALPAGIYVVNNAKVTIF